MRSAKCSFEIRPNLNRVSENGQYNKFIRNKRSICSLRLRNGCSLDNYSFKQNALSNITGNIQTSIGLNNIQFNVPDISLETIIYTSSRSHNISNSDVSKCRMTPDFKNVNLFLDISLYFAKFTFDGNSCVYHK